MSISSLIGQMVLGLGAFGFAVLMTKPLSELFRHSDVFLMALSQVKVLLPLGIATFLIGLIGFFFFIRFLKSLGVEQFIREEGPQSHQIKQGTPTGGGILFISLWAVMSILCVYLLPLFPPLKLYYGHAPLAPEGLPFYGSSPYFYAPLGVSVLLMGLGMWDDLAKVLKKQNKGLGARAKLVVQAGIGLLFGLIMAFVLGDTTVNVFGHGVTLTTWQYLLYATFAVTALSNAVNLTDGLDGLAGGSTYFTLVIFSLLLMTQQGHTETYPSLLLLLLALPCLLAFLPHNRYPARIFMGDSGSLALGGFIASIGLMTHQDGWLLLSAGLFTIEALSVALQVLSFKYLGKRIFKMAPLHHHFELCGWNEQTVVQVFLSVHLLLCLLAFALERLV